MPRNSQFRGHLHEADMAYRMAAARYQYQRHWYTFLGKHLSAGSVLDVGSSDGYGLKLLREMGYSADGIDISPLSHRVQLATLCHMPRLAWDHVIAIDVIEHVEDDMGFLVDMLRCARVSVFFATPNWNRFKCCNPFHIREYTPDELIRLVHAARALRDGNISYYLSDDFCRITGPVLPNERTETANFGVHLEFSR